MTKTVVVLGAGYAGTNAIARLQELNLDDLDLHWVADSPYHLVRHEVHRVVRRPAARYDLTVPVDDVVEPATTFTQGVVTDIDTDERTIAFEDGDSLSYEYVLVALGSETAFYGIDGLAEHAHTLASLDDALAIHEAIEAVAEDATVDDPAQVVIGGGGLSGIQTAGEVAAYRDEHDAPIEVTLVEALRRILPMGDDDLQSVLEDALASEGVRVLTNDPIVESTEDSVVFDDREPIPSDVLVWTGGVKGRSLVSETDLQAEHDRIVVETDFQTDDDRVFAVGDSALVDGGDETVPPTAQAAMQAATVAAENLVREARGSDLEHWSYRDLGTLVSVGEHAFANDVLGLPVGVVGGTIARTLKKGVAARWIASITSWPRAIRAWNSL